MANKPRLELSATQVIGGALAAVSAAVAASLLGVYGTVAGAAVVSIVASVGGAVYTHSFRRGKQAIDKAREHRTGRQPRIVDPDGAPADATPPTDDTASASEPSDSTDTEPADAGSSGGRTGWRSRLAGINPKAVAVTALCVLVLSLGSILLVETVMNKPISSALGHGDTRGGNSLTRLVDSGSSSTPRPSTTRTETPTSTPTTTVTKTESPDDQSTHDPSTTTPTRQPTSAPTTSKPTPPPTSSKPPETKSPEQQTTGGAAREQVPPE